MKSKPATKKPAAKRKTPQKTPRINTKAAQTSTKSTDDEVECGMCARKFRNKQPKRMLPLLKTVCYVQQSGTIIHYAPRNISTQ